MHFVTSFNGNNIWDMVYPFQIGEKYRVKFVVDYDRVYAYINGVMHTIAASHMVPFIPA